MADIGMTVGLIKALAPKPDAESIASAVDDWLDDHPEATTTVEDGSITKAKLDADLKAEIEKKADNDGLYEQMTVGNAEQLVATVGIVDKVPYNFRTAGGAADIGDRLTEKIVGGTVVWNQLLSSQNAVSGYTKFDITLYAVSNKFAFTANGTFNCSSGDRNLYIFNQISGEKLLAGHKYLITNTSKYFCAYIYGAGTPAATLSGNRLNVNNQGGTIIACSAEGEYRVSLHCGTNIANNTAIDETIYINLYDLTQMFGSTIADYIYSLETATAGAGVAWFRKLFPEDYYAYDAGSLQSVQAKSHVMRGFNAWDEEWEEGFWNTDTGEKGAWSGHIRFKNHMPVLPGTTYYKKCPAASFSWHLYYDANKNYIGKASVSANTTFTTPANAYYMTSYTETGYGSTYKNDLCINLSWDGERDGEYEAYDEHVYPLDDSLTLRGIPKLDANNNLYYDGDTYESDGTVTRRYGIVDLGSRTWTYIEPTTGIPYGTFYNTIYGKKYGQFNIICDRYSTQSGFSNDKSIQGNSGASTIYLTDSSFNGDAAALKTALNGVYLVYELETPTTESADPYQNPQIVDDFGTEEYIDAGVTASTPTRDVAIPVGHDTTYQANLRAKLEMAPESPDGDGDYIVRQTNGQNEYVELVIPTELPTAPTTDGNYILKCTVSSGTATYTWEAQS